MYPPFSWLCKAGGNSEVAGTQAVGNSYLKPWGLGFRDRRWGLGFRDRPWGLEFRDLPELFGPKA